MKRCRIARVVLEVRRRNKNGAANVALHDIGGKRDQRYRIGTGRIDNDKLWSQRKKILPRRSHAQLNRLS